MSEKFLNRVFEQGEKSGDIKSDWDRIRLGLNAIDLLLYKNSPRCDIENVVNVLLKISNDNRCLIESL